MSGIQGRPTSKRLEGATKDLRDMHYVTVQPIGSNRNAIDVTVMGAFIVSQNLIVEAGSTNNLIVLTGHSVKRGDVIRFKTTVNPIEEAEVTVDKIIDANSFELSGVLSHSLSTGDTFDLLRPITQQFTSNGSQIVSVTPAPTSFVLDGSEVQVEEDTANPANNKAFPVKLVDYGGTITLTADQLNISLSHTEDSIKIGDGTNLASVTGNNELKVFDTEANDKLADANDSLLDIKTDLADIKEKLLDIEGIDFAKEDKQDTQIAELQDIEADIEAGNLLLGTIDTDTGNIASSTSSIDNKLDTTNSVLFTIFADTGNLLAASQGMEADLDANLRLHDEGYNPATMKHSLIAGVRQNTLAENSSADGDVQNLKTNNLGELYVKDSTIAARLPSALGQSSMANSLSVTIANNQTSLPIIEGGKSIVTFHRRDYSSSNVTTAAWSELIASMPADVISLEIFDSSGQTLKLGVGSSGSEVDLVLVFPGGNGMIPLEILAGARLAIKAVSANATEGEICINLYGN